LVGKHRVINHVLFAANPDRRFYFHKARYHAVPPRPRTSQTREFPQRESSLSGPANKQGKTGSREHFHPSSDTHTFDDPLSAPNISAVSQPTAGAKSEGYSWDSEQHRQPSPPILLRFLLCAPGRGEESGERFAESKGRTGGLIAGRCTESITYGQAAAAALAAAAAAAAAEIRPKTGNAGDDGGLLRQE
ncbi:unnamed protein product, partial [Ectocarpus sp. 12 AP-2014]